MLVTGRQLAAAHSRGELTGTREPAATLVPPPLSSGAVYALSFALQWRWRLALAVLGTLLLVNAVPVLLVVAPDSVRSLAPNGLLPQVSGALGSALAFLLMLYGLTGLALLLVAQDYASSTVRADAVGVTRRIGKASTSLAWDDIERVSASSRRGRMSAYSVTGNLGRTIISWPAQSSALRALMPAPDAMPVTPEELAALVASRSGKALEHV
jgi:hypothetical protein